MDDSGIQLKNYYMYDITDILQNYQLVWYISLLLVFTQSKVLCHLGSPLCFRDKVNIHNCDVIFLILGALFDPKEKSTEADFTQRQVLALENFQTFLRPLLQLVTGPHKFEEGTRLVFNGLQDPVANKQLALVLLDAVVAEIFPELEK